MPQVRIESLADSQVEEFINLYCPQHGAALWQNLRGTAQLEILRSPYYLTLLVTQASSGAIPQGHAALFSNFMRQALQREIDADNDRLRRLLPPDVEQWFTQRAWRTPYELPEAGAMPHLRSLAFHMQSRRTRADAAQVRLAYDDAVATLGHPRLPIFSRSESIWAYWSTMCAVRKSSMGTSCSRSILRRGIWCSSHIDRAASGDGCRARLVRHLAPRSVAELVQQDWCAQSVQPGLQETLAALADADPLPPLPGTGWEETTLLAVAMASDRVALLTALMEHNLPLAGRCAAQPDVDIPSALRDRIRQALVQRTQDHTADLRARIAAGLALGAVGDPRFVSQEGAWGTYLLPPLIEIAGGTYTIGNDDGAYADEAPVHPVVLQPFALAQFPVTNAEWRLFMQAGGYEEERWWDTDEARAWQRGEGTAEGAKQQWREDRKRLQDDFDRIRQLHQQGRITSQQADDWEAIAGMQNDEFEALLNSWYPPGRRTQPQFWHDDTLNNPAQPVVGVCWFEGAGLLCLAECANRSDISAANRSRMGSCRAW